MVGDTGVMHVGGCLNVNCFLDDDVCTNYDVCRNHNVCTIHDVCASHDVCTDHDVCRSHDVCTIHDVCTDHDVCTIHDVCTDDDGCMSERGCDDEVITGRVIACIIRVHRTLGPGFLESIYRRALLIELQAQQLATVSEQEVLVHYRGRLVGRHRLDLLVEGRLILELKTVEALSRAHYAQVRSYLTAARLDLALLVNFAGDRADFRRIERR